MTLNLGVLASGRGSNLGAILRAEAQGELPARVAVVIGDRPGAGALDVARRQGVPAFCIEPGRDGRVAYEARIVSCLERHGVDLVCLAGFMRVVGPALLGRYPGRILNIHPSLLPAFPGRGAQRQAWEHGVKVTGCTVHFVDEGVDTGPIILQRAVAVGEEDDPEALAARILQEEHAAYPEAIRLLAEGRLTIAGRRVIVAAPGSGGEGGARCGGLY
ncbi:MAG TPA: phosphoribosylglycinamide formyltransferase [Clostridiales bacterium]|nr:phosphoribosylglycinamide formyltransferase [Clostridiales bacterium]